jgi:hypothetical protein
MNKSAEQTIADLKHQNAIMRRLLEQVAKSSWGIWESFVAEVKKTLKELS